MERILHTPVSGLHVTAALLAVFFGTTVVLLPKGTRRHRQLGYAYVASMLVVNGTAFGIYELFGHFGVVHWGAVMSLLTLTGGMGMAILKQPAKNWRFWHEALMGWSVTGLYAAGLVESTYRMFPAHYFWWVTMGLSAITFLTGGFLLRYGRQIYARFGPFRRVEAVVSQKKIENGRLKR
ncbi:DUF2306 domain-containing protein [Tellurirhabdus rosea]|uniref:hypothetical protein n=1 Tax=Tellurirhabdus rosea TaxID=2674997 RepID=UPI0022571337|nr:hypothetical protein [Tellurirhabdus rosea]